MQYVPSFYGEMTDAINAGDESDRLLMAWDVAASVPDRPRQGDDVTDPILVPTPDDVVELRRSDPEAVGGVALGNPHRVRPTRSSRGAAWSDSRATAPT